MDEEGLPFIKRMAKELPYFPAVVDDNTNPDGWTPSMWAAKK